MRHAYLITIHKNFRILEFLLRVLDYNENDFFILIDKKVGLPLKDICTYVPQNSRVVELEAVEINWGGYSQINAELLLLKAALSREYDYYHFMQGSDFPIKTAKEINQFFEKNYGYEFIDFEPKNYEFAKFKCDYWHVFIENSHYRKNRFLKLLNHSFIRIQKLFGINRHDRELFHGSALFSITHDCAEYIVSIEREIYKRYKYSLAADEVFLQTEIYHSKFQERLYKNKNRYSNVRFIDWDHRQGSSPYTFKKEDFDLLMSKENMMFARKFDESEIRIVEMLYQYLR